MLSWKLEFGVNLLGTAPQIRVVDTGGPTNYDITIPAGTYFFSVDTTAKNDIIQTLDGLITAAVSFAGAVAMNANGRQIDFDSNSGDYTLRLLDCDDAEPLAMLLGLYGDNYDWDYYQSNNAPATWRVPGNVCWFDSGFDQPQYDADGFPEWQVDHRVTEAGAAVHLARSRRDIVNLTLNAVPGATLRGMATDDGAYGGSATDSVSLWRAYNPDLNEPLVHIYCASRYNEFYYLQKPLTQEDVRRLGDRWNGHYDVDLELAVADV
jgi:hypothetical protein